MRSSRIKQIEEEIKKKTNLDVELCYDNGFYKLLYIINVKENKKHLSINEYDYNPYVKLLFSFRIINHPNCGMDIIQNITFNTYDTVVLKKVKSNIINDLFKYTIRSIFPESSNKHVFFTFQNNLLTTRLTKIGWQSVFNYTNYNHGATPDRSIWMLDIKDYKGLVPVVKTKEKKIIAKAKTTTSRSKKQVK